MQFAIYKAEKKSYICTQFLHNHTKKTEFGQGTYIKKVTLYTLAMCRYSVSIFTIISAITDLSIIVTFLLLLHAHSAAVHVSKNKGLCETTVFSAIALRNHALVMNVLCPQ